LVTVVQAGDVQLDGRINVADATLALQIAVGLKEPTPAQSVAADVAPTQADGTIGDGKVTAADVTVILRAALGLQTSITPADSN
jgi:hypothetical protein